MRKSIIGAVCACLSVVSINANAVLLKPYDLLRFEFSYLPNNSVAEDTFNFVAPRFENAITTLTTPTTSSINRLYDEGVLLGTYTQTPERSDNQFYGFFKTPTSLFAFGDPSPTVTDLSSIEDGTDTGVVVMMITSGLLDIDSSFFSGDFSRMFRFCEALSSSSCTGTNVEVTGVSIIPAVPIPSAVWLFGSGLIGLVGFVRRKKA